VPPTLDVPQRDLTVFLLKERIKTHDDALRDKTALKTFPLTTSGGSEIGTLYVKTPRAHPPRWASFFEDYLDVTQLGRVSSTAAVMLVKTQRRLLALSFGQGRFLLVPDCWEERFGLRVVLNAIQADRLRSLDKRTFDALSTHTRIQGSREGSAPDFGLDIEQDLVRAVTGSPQNNDLGKTLSGMDSLHCVVRVAVDGLKELLGQYLRKSAETTYKTTFPWIDHIAEVTDRGLVETLDEQLSEKVNGTRDRCWLCVPEIIDWGRTGGFRYAFTSRSPEYSDLNFDGFLESTSDGAVDINLLKRRRAYQVGNEGRILDDWSIYRCVYCEIDHGGHSYVLSNTRWYRVDTDFVRIVNEFFDSLPRYEATFPEFDDASEGEYCARISKDMSATYALMDQKPIPIGGAYGKVEFCDLFTAAKDMIHIKRYGASSVLSHLFSQGVVAGEAFRSDATFRSGVIDRLPETYRVFTEEQVPQPAEYRVVFAVISEKATPLTLPFFSRVNIRQACRRLQAFGYRTEIAKIQVSEQKAKLKKYPAR
jgi:uncharacterized protein (TIGR04141 family)